MPSVCNRDVIAFVGLAVKPLFGKVSAVRQHFGTSDDRDSLAFLFLSPFFVVLFNP
jgi:hypothetical protein